MKKLLRPTLGLIVGVAVMFIGIELLSVFWRWVFNIDIVLSVLTRYELVFIIVYFLVSLSIYGAPYHLARNLSVAITQGVGVGTILAVAYLLIMSWAIYYSMDDPAFTYAMYAMIVCAIGAIRDIYLFVKVRQELKNEEAI